MDNIEIRLMTESDAFVMAEIEKDNFSRPWSREDFVESFGLDYTIYLVAEQKETGRVVAYCGCYQSFEEGNITNVAVDKSYRRCGIAEKLIEEMVIVGRQRGIERFVLEVRVSNVPAIGLYEKKGFAIAGVRKDFYAEPKEDAYIMVL